MIIVRLKGGIGNQMFQYALGRALSLKNDIPFKLDLGVYKKSNYFINRNYSLDVFNIVGEVAQESEIPLLYRANLSGRFFSIIGALLRKIIKTKGKESFFHFDPRVFFLGDDLYLDGYWQSYKYFDEIREVIEKDFTLKNKLPENTELLRKEILESGSLCVHIRRGDYVGNKSHEVVGKDYYDRAIEKVKSLKKIDKIYVFSDDIEWCKKNMTFDFPAMFVSGEYAGEKGEGHMILMSAGKSLVIANSSFSWWSAWLGDNSNKVIIAPKNWFPNSSINTNDLIPQTWIKI